MPKHPYRDSALLYGGLAVLVVVVAVATGGEFVARAGLRDRRLPRRDGLELALLAEPRARGTHPQGRTGRMTATEALDAKVDALCGDLARVRAPRGTELNARSWSTEAPLRMLLNNLDAEVAEHPEQLIVYGGSGQGGAKPGGAARDRARVARARRRRDAARAERQAGRRLPHAFARRRAC